MHDDPHALNANIAAALAADEGEARLPAPDPALVDRMLKLTMPVVRYFRTQVEGAWRLPRDRGCLLIGNHAVFAIDALTFFPALHRETGRLLRGLADHNLFRVPVLDRLMHDLGVVDGRRDTAIGLLRAGEWVICYPGGARDAIKEPGERYTLKWQGRMGYLRVALAAGVPLVPLAAVGVDDAYVTLGRERRVGRRLFGKRAYDLPLLMGLGPMPLPVRFRFVIGEPIDLEAELGLTPIYADAPDAELHEAHLAIWRRVQGTLDREVGRRLSRFL